VGSFLNVVIYRLPRHESIVFPPSHCPHCGRAIKWYDNIPILSWLILHAKCRWCKAPISGRYILIETATAGLIAGLYICYYVLDVRDGSGSFGESYPMFIAHSVLLCALLACSVIDIDNWIVPLEVCWVASVVGLVCSAASPHPWTPAVSPAGGAMSLGAIVGLGLALVLLRYGLIRRSFIDADNKPPPPRKQTKTRKRKGRKRRPKSVAITRDSGVNPRREVLREVLFLGPAIVLAGISGVLVTKLPPLAQRWEALLTGPAGPHINGLLSSLFGYLVGGAWIWGIRILGTLAFGKEAMGLGDVHILAAVGAVTGWVIPSITFFVAPVFGLLWALWLWARRNQRELPYGPWLGAGALIIMLFYDAFAELLAPYTEMLKMILQ